MAASHKESFLILTSLFEGVNPGYELYLSVHGCGLKHRFGDVSTPQPTLREQFARTLRLLYLGDARCTSRVAFASSTNVDVREPSGIALGSGDPHRSAVRGRARCRLLCLSSRSRPRLQRPCQCRFGHQLSSPSSPRRRPARDGSLMRESSVPVTETQQDTSLRYSAGSPLSRIFVASPSRRKISIERAET